MTALVLLALALMIGGGIYIGRTEARDEQRRRRVRDEMYRREVERHAPRYHRTGGR